MTYTYYPRGVCSQKMEIDLDGETIADVRIMGGCSGNLQGISRLVRGERLTTVADKLRGISCGGKATSCPDQLARAIDEIIEKGGYTSE